MIVGKVFRDQRDTVVEIKEKKIGSEIKVVVIK